MIHDPSKLLPGSTLPPSNGLAIKSIQKNARPVGVLLGKITTSVEVSVGVGVEVSVIKVKVVALGIGVDESRASVRASGCGVQVAGKKIGVIVLEGITTLAGKVGGGKGLSGEAGLE
jgi:hypothetical protein